MDDHQPQADRIEELIYDIRAGILRIATFMAPILISLVLLVASILWLCVILLRMEL